MTFKQFLTVLKEINENHRFGILSSNSKSVNYVYPVIDMRDNKVCIVKIRFFGGEKVFSSFRQNIFEEIMAWLKS